MSPALAETAAGLDQPLFWALSLPVRPHLVPFAVAQNHRSRITFNLDWQAWAELIESAPPAPGALAIELDQCPFPWTAQAWRRHHGSGWAWRRRNVWAAVAQLKAISSKAGSAPRSAQG